MTKHELHAQYGPKLVVRCRAQARAAVEADTRLISPSYTRSYPLWPSVAGNRVEDVDGNEFLDFARHRRGFDRPLPPRSCCCHSEASCRADPYLKHDFYDEHITALGDRLSAVAPMPGRTVFLRQLRAEAIECALKLARYHTGRQQIISSWRLPRRTMGALSLTGSSRSRSAAFRR